MANFNFLGKDDLVTKGNKRVRKTGSEITGTDGGGVVDPNLLFRLDNENKRGLEDKPENKTFREAVAELEKINGKPTLFSQIKADRKVTSDVNRAAYMNHIFAREVQKSKGKKSCDDLARAFQKHSA